MTSNSHPRISVVVPSFNQGNFLPATLESIVSQGYPNLELIVMDGGSSDDSVDVIRRYESKISYWQSQPDGGQTDALIQGFSRATGDIFCWINSDDLMLNNSMHHVARVLDGDARLGAVYGDTIWIDREGRTLRQQREMGFNRFIWLHTYNYIPGMSMYWRRSVYEQVGGLNSKFNLAMDSDLWLRMSRVCEFGHVRAFWSAMRFYPEQKNRRLRDASNQEDDEIRRQYWGTAHPPLLRTRQLAARAMRIAVRLSTGCYGWGYRPDMSDGEPR